MWIITNPTHILEKQMEDYEVLSVLGKGSYGKIYKATRKSDGLVCVIKQIGLEGLSPEERADTLNEVCSYAPGNLW